MVALKFLALLLFVAVATEALDCIPCDPKTCVAPEGCKGGLTPDICLCCQRCAKVLGENCAGPFNLTGICDVGLECEIPANGDWNAIGKCKAKKFAA